MQVVCDLWNWFAKRFRELWDTEACTGGLSAAPVFADDPPARAAAQDAFMAVLLQDALRFAGCSMVRRLVGIAHNADFERIEGVDVRATCEARGLRLGRKLLVECGALPSIEAVCEAARVEREDGESPCAALPSAS